MDDNHELILELSPIFSGRSCIAPRAYLYYYQGNFYHPLDLIQDRVGKVKRAIREFIKNNKERIEKDRSHPDYKTLVQLFDEQ